MRDYFVPVVFQHLHLSVLDGNLVSNLPLYLDDQFMRSFTSLPDLMTQVVDP